MKKFCILDTEGCPSSLQDPTVRDTEPDERKVSQVSHI